VAEGEKVGRSSRDHFTETIRCSISSHSLLFSLVGLDNANSQ
jgi:hypothetical protein